MVSRNSVNAIKHIENKTLSQLRLDYLPPLPPLLSDLESLELVTESFSSKTSSSSKLKEMFPSIGNLPVVRFQKSKAPVKPTPLKVGVVLSGGQASGGHNVITGLLDGLIKLHPQSQLFGFLNGPKGIIENKSKILTEEVVAPYRNQGGFDLLGSGRDKIETPEQFQAAEATVKALGLDGLVIVGGDDSNTNAALLAEFFQSQKNPCRVIGVPKTIDGDLKNEWVEVSFGFDTAAKTYAEIIGNIARDAISAKKYYYFIKLMGRSASHITLECALQTQPNIALIGEEVEERKQTVANVVSDIADGVCLRAAEGKNFGIILIPEGIVEFIPEFKLLIQELNQQLAPAMPHAKKLESLPSREERLNYMKGLLSNPSAACFASLPSEIALQLLLDRDPHGNVQVSRIETERLFINLVEIELKKRKQLGKYNGKFSALPIFCGYEGRSALPSNFDSQYCYSLGHVAALLVHLKATGYLCAIKKLAAPVDDWEPMGAPLVPLMHLEERHGKSKPVIRKALVDLKGNPFNTFKKQRDLWKQQESYRYPGPIQFYGPSFLTEAPSMTLLLET